MFYHYLTVVSFKEYEDDDRIIEISILLEVIICAQVKKCGIDFRWNMFGMTEKVIESTKAAKNHHNPSHHDDALRTLTTWRQD